MLKHVVYRELLLTGNLSGYCKAIDKTAFEHSGEDTGGLAQSTPMPLEDTMERIRLRIQARDIADEIVFAELIYTKKHCPVDLISSIVASSVKLPRLKQ